MLVDLAGADYDHRAGAGQKESAAINKSLLALKECFRSLAKESGSRAKFRDSKLTRLLEHSLAPTVKSERRNMESASVMLVNVSPAAELQKGTVNALRYGQIYGGGGRATGRGGRTLRAGGLSQQSAAKTQAIIVALKAIYSEHVPEKTEAEVDEIIAKFTGREHVLLRKVRAKYVLSEPRPGAGAAGAGAGVEK